VDSPIEIIRMIVRKGVCLVKVVLFVLMYICYIPTGGLVYGERG